MQTSPSTREKWPPILMQFESLFFFFPKCALYGMMLPITRYLLMGVIRKRLRRIAMLLADVDRRELLQKLVRAVAADLPAPKKKNR